jgi:hypothetical protein
VRKLIQEKKQRYLCMRSLILASRAHQGRIKGASSAQCVQQFPNCFVCSRGRRMVVRVSPKKHLQMPILEARELFGDELVLPLLQDQDLIVVHLRAVRTSHLASRTPGPCVPCVSDINVRGSQLVLALAGCSA